MAEAMQSTATDTTTAITTTQHRHHNIVKPRNYSSRAAASNFNGNSILSTAADSCCFAFTNSCGGKSLQLSTNLRFSSSPNSVALHCCGVCVVVIAVVVSVEVDCIAVAISSVCFLNVSVHFSRASESVLFFFLVNALHALVDVGG